MTSKFACFCAATAFALSMTALGQAPSASAGMPSASGSAVAATGAGSKIGTINIEQAIFASNEGQRDFETLNKKLEPKQNELKSMNEELEALKKQLNVQGDKLSQDAHDTLVSQIGQKQKVFDRTVQDARDDMQNQQNEIAQKILQKLAPILMKYASENSYGLILDTSQPWPQGPVICCAGSPVDLTKTIVEMYNTQSGVAAPARPAATRPSGAAKPATPSSTKP